MSMYETKTVQVDNKPEKIDQVTREYARFMWQVQSQQVTNFSDTDTRVTGSDEYNTYYETTTKSANYCTITFQRDQLMPHYNEMAEYENRLPALLGRKPKKPSEPVELGLFGRLLMFLLFGMRVYFPLCVILLGVFALIRKAYMWAIIVIICGGIWLYFAIKHIKRDIVSEKNEYKKGKENYPEALQQYEINYANWEREVTKLNKAIDDLHKTILAELRR